MIGLTFCIGDSLLVEIGYNFRTIFFQTKKLFEQKKYLTKIFFVRKILFCPKIFHGLEKNFGPKRNIGQKNFLVKQFFGLKKILVRKLYPISTKRESPMQNVRPITNHKTLGNFQSKSKSSLFQAEHFRPKSCYLYIWYFRFILLFC